MDLVHSVYEVTEDFPDHERFGLAKQLRSAAISIPSNLAEGSGRQSARELRRFALIARGSAKEIETQLQLALELRYVDSERHARVHRQVDDLCRMLAGLTRSLSRRAAPSTPNAQRPTPNA